MNESAEDEAFNEIERMSKIRKWSVENSINRKRQIENRMTEAETAVQSLKSRVDLVAKTPEEFYSELRNNVIEEVAVAIERMESFGKDTISSFAIYIRSMKE